MIEKNMGIVDNMAIKYKGTVTVYIILGWTDGQQK